MSYSFEVTKFEHKMKSFFKGVSGINIKDTLFITLRNTGTKGWEKFKGSFICITEKSNYFFEETQITQEVYPNELLDLVLHFPRSKRNNSKGNCFSTIQLIYNNEEYNSQILRFSKNFDLYGNELSEERKAKTDEENKNNNDYKIYNIEKETKDNIKEVGETEEKEEPKKENKEDDYVSTTSKMNENEKIIKKNEKNFPSFYMSSHFFILYRASR